VGNDPINNVDPNGLAAEAVLNGAVSGKVDLLTTPGHYFGTTLPNATAQLLSACGALCDPGVQMSIGDATGALALGMVATVAREA